MTNQNIMPFALALPDIGFCNQIMGAFNALLNLTGNRESPEHLFVLPQGCSSIYDVKESLKLTQLDVYSEFKSELFSMLDNYFKNVKIIPRIFICVYNLTESKRPEHYIDMLCRAIKEYYKACHLGDVFTTVLTSRLHSYKYVDLINVPKHLLTFTSRIRLLQNPEIRKKVLITVGIINNFDIETINEKFRQFQQSLEKIKDSSIPELEILFQKYSAYAESSKKVVFCLGGRVDGLEIIFDVSYANRLYQSAERLVANGYGVIFVNGPRTPNDVTDFLYEKSLGHPSIIFQNCKRVAENDDDRVSTRWRIYSGRNEAVFKTQRKLGNIYPGILGFPNTLVVHTADTYACCETAGVAIKTAVSANGIYIDPNARYDCLNLYKLLCPKYVVDFDEFVQTVCNMKIEPKDIHTDILSNPLRVFAETVVKRFGNGR